MTDEKESGLAVSIESHCDEKTSRIMERESDMTTQLLKNVITAVLTRFVAVEKVIFNYAFLIYIIKN